MKRMRTRVSFVLPPKDGHAQHLLGVNSLVLSASQQTLYTCSRDATVRAWDLSATENNTIESSKLAFEEHTDWVNDCVLCADDQRLLTVSSDTSLKVWDCQTGNCLGSVTKHSDYIKALAYASGANLAASAGLDKSIYLWDLEKLTAINTLTSPLEPTYSLANLQKSSIYSLGMNSAGTVMVSGSPEKALRLWDPRSGKRLIKLIGHTDNVKAVLVDNDGTMCLSGSSDSTVKLWDIGQQRCLATYTMHEDSVWTLAADPTFNCFYSGSKDGSVFRTNRSQSTSMFLLKESASISKLATSSHGIWVATTRSDINCWDDGSSVKDNSESMIDLNKISSSSTTSQSLTVKPWQQKPIKTIQGSHGIIEHAILNNKRHVLTRNTAGNVELWDIVTGVKVRDCGNSGLDEIAQTLNDVTWVPNWFSLDVKTGLLTIHLDESTCFAAELFANDVSDIIPPELYNDDTKVNVGHLVLSAIFRAWRTAYYQRVQALQKKKHDEQNGVAAPAAVESTVSKDEEESPTSSLSTAPLDSQMDATNASANAEAPPPKQVRPTEPLPPKDDTSLFGRLRSLAPSVGLRSTSSNATPITSPNMSAKDTVEPEQPSMQPNSMAFIMSAPFDFPGKASVIISEEAASAGTSVGIFRCHVDVIDRECTRLEEVSPQWLFECVLKDRFVVKDQTKYSFLLAPEDEKDMPQLPQSNRRLSANRILRVKKIIAFVLQKLKMDEKDGELRYDILCNDKVLGADMNLGTIKNCIWKSGAELQLFYRRKKTITTATK